MRRKIGLVGGVSPESTVEYYQYIVRKYHERYGDLHFPEVIIYSVRFKQLCEWSDSGHWKKTAAELVRVGNCLEAAGAEGLMLTANTLHYVIGEFTAGVNVPVISILDVVADAIEESGISKVGLLGTKYTMELPFYRDALARRNIEVLVPDSSERQVVSDIIYGELIKGIIREESKQTYLAALSNLAKMGAEGLILGCTEIPLLIKPADTDLPQFNTTELHAEAALQFAVGDELTL